MKEASRLLHNAFAHTKPASQMRPGASLSACQGTVAWQHLCRVLLLRATTMGAHLTLSGQLPLVLASLA